MLCHFSVYPMNANVLNPIVTGDDEEKFEIFFQQNGQNPIQYWSNV